MKDAHDFFRMALICLLALCFTLPTFGAEEAAAPEATSLLGEPLYRPDLADAFAAKQKKFLQEARAKLAKNPDDADALVWAGRRTAYLGRYNEAIEIFSEGIERHPKDARFLRHRGHRYLSVRRIDEAIADFTRAGELLGDTEPIVEPDGLPNALGIPTSTLHGNVWYHLGLAHLLKGDFESALKAYEKCLVVSGNPDMLVATSHWLYMTLRRLGRDADAAKVLEKIHAEMEIIENASYHHLLMLYKNHAAEESLPMPDEGEALDRATIGFGVGHWELYNGRPEAAEKIFRRVVEGGPWASFGALAAEAELSRSAL